MKSHWMIRSFLRRDGDRHEEEKREKGSLLVNESTCRRIRNTTMVFSMEALSNRGGFFYLQWMVLWEGCYNENFATLECPKVLTCVLDSWTVLVSEKKKSANSIELIGKTSETKFWHFSCQIKVRGTNWFTFSHTSHINERAHFVARMKVRIE